MIKRRLTALTLMLCVMTGLLSGCGEGTAPTTELTQATTPAPGVTEPSVPETTVPTTSAPEPELPTVLDFLQTALLPVGSTMYIWGGGWNEEDTGAGAEAVTLGVSPAWNDFADAQDGDYDYKNHRYQLHDGLDCSGYIGWAVYNTLETENGREGYVSKATGMAQDLANRGLGAYIPREELENWLPGDIMSMKGHVWISLGMCDDGSVLLLHSSPPGVILCGTALPDGNPSQAVELAEAIMSTQYPQWYARYPRCDRPYRYLGNSSAMRWDEAVLSDPYGIRQMSAPEAAALLFPEFNH